jgi:hypothetical protein
MMEFPVSLCKKTHMPAALPDYDRFLLQHDPDAAGRYVMRGE